MGSDSAQKRTVTIVTIMVAYIIVASCCIAYFGFYLPDMQEEEEKQRMVEEYYAEKLSKYAAENEQYADYEVDVAFLGDSLTDGCDLELYYPEFVTSNRGIGGETTIGLEKRMDISLYQLKPKVAVLLIGGNNLDTMLDNYEDIILGIKENVPHTKILICSLTSMGMDFADRNHIAAYNNVVLKKLANNHGCAFVDLYSPLFDLTTGEIRSEYSWDGAHLTHSGNLVISGEIKPALVELFDDWSPPD